MPAKKILLVDGYNVINRVPELRAALAGGLENARNRLALRVSAWGRDHPEFERVIVFDGGPRSAGAREERSAGTRWFFSRAAHGGDDEIIRFVRDYQGRTSDITVVSDDNNIGNNCRAHGAAVVPASFILARQTARAASRGRPSAAGKTIDRKAAAEIDRELRKKFGL